MTEVAGSVYCCAEYQPTEFTGTIFIHFFGIMTVSRISMDGSCLKVDTLPLSYNGE